MSADRDLFLHEFIDINGMHQWDYMEHTLQQSGDEKVEFELLGTWYTMGITARWPQVVNIWEIPGGWDGWRDWRRAHSTVASDFGAELCGCDHRPRWLHDSVLPDPGSPADTHQHI